jgi:protein phosphatase-4 regulatory subunit 3
MALIDHDTLMMRGQVFKAVNDHQKPLTDILIELLLVETDLGVIMQMADAVKILLDPAANLQSLDAISRSNGDFFKMIKERGTGGNLQADGFAGELYKEGARKLFKPIVELESKENCERHIPASIS